MRRGGEQATVEHAQCHSSSGAGMEAALAVLVVRHFWVRCGHVPAQALHIRVRRLAPLALVRHEAKVCRRNVRAEPARLGKSLRALAAGVQPEADVHRQQMPGEVARLRVRRLAEVAGVRSQAQVHRIGVPLELCLASMPAAAGAAGKGAALRRRRRRRRRWRRRRRRRRRRLGSIARRKLPPAFVRQGGCSIETAATIVARHAIRHYRICARGGGGAPPLGHSRARVAVGRRAAHGQWRAKP